MGKRGTRKSNARTRRNLLLAAITATCAVGLGAGQAMAAIGYWTGSGADNNWYTAGNWENNTVPGSATGPAADTARIDYPGHSVVNTTKTTINLDSDLYIATIDDWSHRDYTIDSTSGHTIYWQGSDNAVRYGQQLTINAPVVATGDLSFQVGQQVALGSKLVFNDTVTYNSNGGLRFLGGNNGTVVFNGAITGPAYLYFNGGTGRVVLNATNNFNGSYTAYPFDQGLQTNVTDQTVVLNHAGAWTANVDLTFWRGGNLEVNATDALTGTTSVTLGQLTGFTQLMAVNSANSYTGGTTIGTATGTLLVNNATGSATGSGDVTVKGTLGGAGFIVTDATHGVTINNGGHLSPGASSGAIGTLTITTGTSGMDISGAVSAANSQSLLFDLDTPTTSDQVDLTGTLIIGSGTLEFDDFAFSPTANLTNGIYTLFDTDSIINGSLGTSLSGAIGTNGAQGVLSLADSGHDLILTVSAVPEPATLALLGVGGLLMLPRRRKGVHGS